MVRFVILGVVAGFVVAMLLLRHPEAAPAQPPAAAGLDRLPASPTELQKKIALTRRAQSFPTPVNEPLRGPDAGAWVVGPR